MTEKIVRQQSRLPQNYEILLNNKRVKIPVLRRLISFIKMSIVCPKTVQWFCSILRLTNVSKNKPLRILIVRGLSLSKQ